MRTSNNRLQVLLVSFLLICSANCYLNIKKVLDSVNLARTEPKKMALIINDDYKAKTNLATNVHTIWNTLWNEKAPAQFDEAISALNGLTPVGKVTLDLGLTYAAWKHARWLAEVKKGIDHTGENGSTPNDRAAPYSDGKQFNMGEIILDNAISLRTVDDLIAAFVIDDGLPKRGHRYNLLSSTYSKAGVGIFTDIYGKDYLVIMFSDDTFNCANCNKITCQQQKESEYSIYLSDIGAADPCRSFSKLLSVFSLSFFLLALAAFI